MRQQGAHAKRLLIQGIHAASRRSHCGRILAGSRRVDNAKQIRDVAEYITSVLPGKGAAPAAKP